MDTLTFGIILLALGFLFGTLLGWLIVRLRYQTQMMPKEEVQAQFVEKNVHQHIQNELDICKDDLNEKNDEILLLSQQLSSRDQMIANLEEKLDAQKKDLEQLQERFKTEFENIANRLLEEKSQKFTAQNQTQIQHLLDPLKAQIKSFEEGIEKRYIEETRTHSSLKAEIEQLRSLNKQLSQDANNLATALKGGNKTQGDWGELQLELLLEKAGLQKDIHYSVQNSFRDAQGQQKRPDFIIKLPEDRHLVIDAKVSLTAYERYFNSDDESDQTTQLKAHVTSVRQHVKDLSRKNYQQLYQINTPDYVLLFIPIEPAFALAAQQDNQLFLDALERNIVLVSPSTLLATMRTVAYIWTQEKQKRSVQEIARQSGLLYDKFCGFVDDLQSLGHRLQLTQNAYSDAMNKLTNSKKYGDTLIGRAQKIKELGAKTSKQLPKELLDES